MPPPAVASTISFASSSCAFCICSCICCDLLQQLVEVHAHCVDPPRLAGVEGLLDSSRISSSLAGSLVARLVLARVLAEREREREAGGRSPRRARRASSVAFFGSSASCRWNDAVARELDRERVAGERRPGAPRAASTRSGSSVSSTAGRIVRCQASCSCSSSSDGGCGSRRLRRLVGCLCRWAVAVSGTGAWLGRGRRARAARAGRRATRARGPPPGRVTFTSASSSGRRGSPPWRMSSTATAQQVDQPEHGRLAELVRLLAQPLARLLGHRQRLGHLAHVLDEHQVAQVLEQVGARAGRGPGPARRAPRRT